MSNDTMFDRRTKWEQYLAEHGNERKEFRSESGIPIKPLYTPLDLEEQGFDYLRDSGFPGDYPFTRGRDSAGYRESFWLFQQYAGFGDAEEANKRYRFLLEQGQSGISVALDLPTQVGIDSDHPLAEGEVGKVGVAIDSLQDLEAIFQSIPLNRPRQISIVANSISLVILAMFIALAKKQGVSTDSVVLRIQNDIMKEFIARGTYIYPPRPSLRLATDLVTYCAEYYPHWLPATFCGYHIREAGVSPSQEIALTLADAIEYMDLVQERGFNVEDILPKLAVMLSVSVNFFEEIAKFRAFRRLWSRRLKERYNIQDVSTLSFNLINFTAGSTLTAQQPLNNIVRVTLECLAGVLGGAQSLFASSMDEAYSTPTESAVKVALRTQQIIAHETDVADTIDPLGGSYFVESMTNSLEEEAGKYLEKIQELGGAVRALESGYIAKMVREEAYKKHKAMENKERIVVGVNEFVDAETRPIEIFKPPRDTGDKQKRKLEKLKKERDGEKVRELLGELEQRAETDENLVPILVKVVENYATLGEISDSFRKVFGEYTERNI
jgi:methylmalonyl-CoA mutase N-terminal domain/subunit